jgi:hypothetical protein
MLRIIRSICSSERGTATVGWIGVTAMVVALVAGLWQALYGGPGQALKAVVQQTVFRYADGFEGGLGSQGPAARYPSIRARRSQSRSSAGAQSAGQMSDGQASSSTTSSGDQSSGATSAGQASSSESSSGQQSLGQASAGQSSDGYASSSTASNSDQSAGLSSVGQSSSAGLSTAQASAAQLSSSMASGGAGFDPQTRAFIVRDAADRRRLVVRPTSLVQIEVDSTGESLWLDDPSGNRVAVLGAYEGHATLIDMTTGAEAIVTLDVLQQLGMIEIEPGSPRPQPSITDGVLGVPWLVGG